MKRTMILLCIVVLFGIGCSSGDSDAEPLPFVDTGVDQDSWALIPAGDFLMGQHEHETIL